MFCIPDLCFSCRHYYVNILVSRRCDITIHIPVITFRTDMLRKTIRRASHSDNVIHIGMPFCFRLVSDITVSASATCKRCITAFKTSRFLYIFRIIMSESFNDIVLITCFAFGTGVQRVAVFRTGRLKYRFGIVVSLRRNIVVRILVTAVHTVMCGKALRRTGRLYHYFRVRMTVWLYKIVFVCIAALATHILGIALLGAGCDMRSSHVIMRTQFLCARTRRAHSEQHCHQDSKQSQQQNYAFLFCPHFSPLFNGFFPLLLVFFSFAAI